MNIRNLFAILITSCTLNSCLPSGDETVTLVAIPSNFQEGWEIAIKCSENSYDEIKASFTIDNENQFVATTHGKLYYGDNYLINFYGYYNPDNDSITGSIHFSDPAMPKFSRICEFGTKWSSYNGDYIPLSTQLLNGQDSDCWDLIKISFNQQPAQ